MRKWLKLFEEQESCVLDLISKNYNTREIAIKVNIPERRLGEILKLKKISINSRYLKKINHDYFDTIDSEDKAYLLGFIIADGCISIEPKKKNGVIYSYNKRISFNNSIDDIVVLNLIKDKISPEVELRVFNNSDGVITRKDQISLKINSKKIVEKMISLNIKPRKTMDFNFKFNFDLLSENHKIDLIRGFIDGDGHFSKKDGRLTFVVTSIDFGNQILDIIKKNIPKTSFTINSIQGKTCIYHSFQINTGIDKDNLFELYKLLYNNKRYFLPRKKETLDSIFKYRAN